MTDTPTPPAMTPEQRAELVKDTKIKSAMIHLGEAIQWGSECALMDQCADQLEADGLALAAAQAEIARLTAALATARADGMREARDVAYQHAQDCLDDGRFHAEGHCLEVAAEIEAAITKGATT